VWRIDVYTPLGVMIADGGLMVSQEYLKLEPPFGRP